MDKPKKCCVQFFEFIPVPVIEYARLVLDCATGVGQQNHDSHVPHHHHEFHFPHYQHIHKTGKLFDHHSLLDYFGPKQLL